MATEGLSTQHQNEVLSFLKFFRTKLDNHLKGLEADFEDTKTDRLSSDDMFNQGEVMDILDSLCSAVKSSVREEFQSSTNMTALLLRQMFREADKEEVYLTLDTSVIEDKVLLEKVQRLRLDTPINPSGLDSKKKESEKRGGKLTVEEEGELREEIERMKKSNAELQKRYEQMQTQCTKALSEKSRLRQELEESKDESNARGKTTAKDEEQVSELKREIRRLNRRLETSETAVQESKGHMLQSKQFQQMKQLLSRKNDELKRVRDALAKYQPDSDLLVNSIDDDDDDDDLVDDDDDDDEGKSNRK